jgi:sugar phosphate isomerase/epimerase
MDTGFYSALGAYPFDTRCEMLAALGYDAAYLTLWNEAVWADLPAMRHVRERFGLDAAAVYVTYDLSAADASEENRRIARMIAEVEGVPRVELALRGEKSLSDQQALEGIEPLLRAAQANGVMLCLYPHITFWLDRHDHAARLCRQRAHPNLGMTFSAFHWYAVDGRNLTATLQAAAPYLQLLNLCGSRRVPDGSGGVRFTLEPVDEGDLDLFALLGAARAEGYRGPVGVQGYAVGGDAYSRFRRSRDAIRDMLDRLQRHPQWAALRETPLP